MLRRQEVAIGYSGSLACRGRAMLTVLLVTVAGWLVALAPGTAAAFTDDCPGTAGNCPVSTESFESVPGLPAGWKFLEYTAGNSTATVVSGPAADGTHFLTIVSSKPNHARVVVPVRVTPHTTYQVHVMAKANGTNENMAAVLGMEGQYTVTNSVRTATQWQPLDLYIKVGPQTIVDVAMGLGYFGQPNVGTADFDAVTVTQVSTIPNGATVADLAAPPAVPANPATAAGSSFSQGPNKVVWIFVGILVVVGIGVAVFLLRRVDTEPIPEGDAERT